MKLCRKPQFLVTLPKPNTRETTQIHYVLLYRTVSFYVKKRSSKSERWDLYSLRIAVPKFRYFCGQSRNIIQLIALILFLHLLKDFYRSTFASSKGFKRQPESVLIDIPCDLMVTAASVHIRYSQWKSVA